MYKTNRLTIEEQKLCHPILKLKQEVVNTEMQGKNSETSE